MTASAPRSAAAFRSFRYVSEVDRYPTADTIPICLNGRLSGNERISTCSLGTGGYRLGMVACLYPQVHPVWGIRLHNPTAATKMSNACFVYFIFLSALSIKTNFFRFFQARRTRKQGTFYGFGGLNGPKAPRIISKCVCRAFRESIQSYRFLPVRLDARTVRFIQTGVIQIQLVLPVDHSSQMKPPPLPQQRCAARQLALVTNLHGRSAIQQGYRLPLAYPRIWNSGPWRGDGKSARNHRQRSANL
jgi:hypothetical protein